MRSATPDPDASAGEPGASARRTAGAPHGGSAGAGRKLRQLAGISVGELHRVGPRRVAGLAALGISSVLDLLTHYPRRYEDWTSSASISELVEGAQVSVAATVASVRRRPARSGRSVVELSLVDDTGRLACTFFNQPWWVRQLGKGSRVVVSGKVTRYRGALQMANPALRPSRGDDPDEALEAGRIVAIYPESERSGIGSAALGRFVVEALERAKTLADPLPETYRRRLRLVDRTTAFWSIHRPETADDHARARRRLVFDELLRLQVALVMRKRALARDARGIVHVVAPPVPSDDLVGRFVAGLPFPLTGAQRRVLAEIAADLSGPVPMHRLLQGDVGAGKTVVALATLLYAVQGGHQGALMVPTEVLAEQHLIAALGLLDGLDVEDPARLYGRRPLSVGLLTSRTTPAARARLKDPSGRLAPDIVVGTHALLTDDVRFRSLGVVVIDEQHRFGVDQRARLREKGSEGTPRPSDPDLLVMTATPIPRTAAMTVYGDLDASVLDELPSGRLPVRTRIASDLDDDAIWGAVRAEVARGRQAFVVCPLVSPGDDPEGTTDPEGATDPENTDGGSGGRSEGKDRLAADRRRDGPAGTRSAVEEAARLQSGALAGCRVGLLHGQLPPREKEEVMRAFRDHELDVLVATTVVEVGVDVADATVMVVEDADRFGLAQLHQLRGRVGRSSEPSTCFLLARDPTEEACRRLEALESTTDGFELAEIDLDLRGEGTVLGSRQKGRSDLKLASLARHRDVVVLARNVAEEIVADDPDLARHPLLADELRLFLGDDEAEYLFRS